MPHVILLKSQPKLDSEKNLTLVLPKENMSVINDTSLRLTRLVLPNNVLFIHEQGSICVHIQHCDTCVFTTSNTKLLCTFLCYPTNKNEYWTEFSCDYMVPIPHPIKKNNTDLKVTISQSNNYEYFISSKESTSIIPNTDTFSKIELRENTSTEYQTFYPEDKVHYGYYSGGRFEYKIPFNNSRRECTPAMPTTASYTEDGELPGLSLGGEKIKWTASGTDEYAFIATVITEGCACVLPSTMSNLKLRSTWGLKKSALLDNQSYKVEDIIKSIFNINTNWDAKGVVLTEKNEYYTDRIQTNLFDYTTQFANLVDSCLPTGQNATYFKVNELLKQELFTLEQSEWNVLQLRCLQTKCTNCSKVIVNRFSSITGKLAEILGLRTFSCNGETTTIVKSSKRYTIDFTRFVDGYITFIIDRPFWLTPRFAIMMNKFTCNYQQFSHLLQLTVKSTHYGNERYYFTAKKDNDKTKIDIYKHTTYVNSEKESMSTIRKSTTQIDFFRNTLQELQSVLLNKQISLHDLRASLVNINSSLSTISTTFANIQNNLFPLPEETKVTTSVFSMEELELALYKKHRGKIKIGTMAGTFNWLHNYDPITKLWTYNKAHGHASSADASFEANYLYVFSELYGITLNEQVSTALKSNVFVYERDPDSMPSLKYKKSSKYNLGSTITNMTQCKIWVISDEYIDPIIAHAVSTFTENFHFSTIVHSLEKIFDEVQEKIEPSSIKPQGRNEHALMKTEQHKNMLIRHTITQIQDIIFKNEVALMKNIIFLCIEAGNNPTTITLFLVQSCIQNQTIQSSDQILNDYINKIKAGLVIELQKTFDVAMQEQIFGLQPLPGKLNDFYVKLSSTQDELNSSNSDLLVKTQQYQEATRSTSRYILSWEAPIFTSALYLMLEDQFFPPMCELKITCKNLVVFHKVLTKSNVNEKGHVEVILDHSINSQHIEFEFDNISDVSWGIISVYAKSESFKMTHNDTILPNDTHATILRFHPKISSEEVSVNSNNLSTYIDVDKASLIYIQMSDRKIIIPYENSEAYSSLYKSHNNPHVQVSLITH